MASTCALCARLLRLNLNRNVATSNIKFAAKRFCTEAKVPQDVLNSKSDSFSGRKSLAFESEKVQLILKRMTGLDLDKVFRMRKEKLVNPVYQALDENELKQREDEAFRKAEQLLEMPTVMTKRSPINVILSEDPEIINHDEDGANFVFTDISSSKDHRNRAIFIRENKTGILREASWDERDRMQFIYWPKDGQHHEIVPMLLDENLPRVFDQLRHEDVLDFINIQCEPDAPDYIRVHHKVYDDLEKRQKYDLLRSTRHFGGMLFHYVANNRTIILMQFLIRQTRLADTVDLLKLHFLIHPESELAKELKDLDHESLLKRYLLSEGRHDLIELLEGEKEIASQ